MREQAGWLRKTHGQPTSQDTVRWRRVVSDLPVRQGHPVHVKVSALLDVFEQQHVFVVLLFQADA